MQITEKFQTRKYKENLLKTFQKENKQINATYMQRIVSAFLPTILKVRKQ